MKPILPKLPIKYSKNHFKNLIFYQNNYSSTARLTKRMSCKKTSSFKKGNNSIFSNTNSSANLKIIGLKELFSHNNINSLNDVKTSIKDDYFSIIKNEQKELSPIKKNVIKDNKLNSIENYKYIHKTFRKENSFKNSEELNKINSFFKKNTKNINHKNKILYLNKKKYNSMSYLNVNNDNINKVKYLKFTCDDKNKLLSIKRKFKNEDLFVKYIIERFIDKKHIAPVDGKHRVIYIILSGTFIINDYSIKGHFINIPTIKELKILTKEKRQKILEKILIQLQNVFGFKKPITSIFSPNKELITDLIDIKNEYKYIYISHTIICKGLSLISTPNFIEIYNTKFKEYLNQIKNINEVKKKINININNFKIRKINRGIKPQREKLKSHYSFTSGENEIESNEYIYYSDAEERKNSALKEINDKCSFKNDFFIYIYEKRIEKKIKNLKNKLNFKKAFNLKKSYDNYTVSFDKLINKYQKELSKKLGINPVSFDSKKEQFDFQDLDTQYEKLYLKRRHKKSALNQKLNNKFYYNIDKNVNKYYSHFVLYNIPKLLNEYKTYTRQRLFEIFTQFKDLMALSFSLNKKEFILKNGIDFYTFWNCIEELAEEREIFARNLFSQINKSNLSVLSIEDFIKGMYFIKNSEITEKLEIFLKSLDISGKGEINFKEAIEISKESILRNIVDQNTGKESSLILNELSNFFANFVFKLVGVEKDKCLKISDLKNAIIQGNQENNGVEYLEMFCGTNKTK